MQIQQILQCSWLLPIAIVQFNSFHGMLYGSKSSMLVAETSYPIHLMFPIHSFIHKLLDCDTRKVPENVIICYFLQ